MMKKIVYLPLDERPCNYDFPSFLMRGNSEIVLVRPDMEIMGKKKSTANNLEIIAFLEKECKNADVLVLSIDTLLYGGIIPSRLHTMQIEQLQSRLDIVREIKKANSKLVIYGFSLIMRCPQYSSDDEEPDYYGQVGKEIFLLGEARNKQELGLLDENGIQKISEYEHLTAYCIDDFLNRRKQNIEMNLRAIDLVGECVDFLIIPQDDSSVYGYTAKDQMIVREYIKEKKLYEKVLMYPGADEVGMTLLGRSVNMLKKYAPTIAVKYSSTMGSTVIPLYEDRIVGETLKYQVMAAGCIWVESVESADIILMVNTPSSNMVSSNMAGQLRREYAIERNIVEMAQSIEYYLSKDRIVALADIAYVNGGDRELVTVLSQKGLLFELSAYAGWNTSSNTIGTAICQAILYRHYKKTKTHEEFLALRYVEDIGYCSFARSEVTANYLPTLGLNYFNAGEKRGDVSKKVQYVLAEFMSAHYKEVLDQFEITDCYMPWSRMFEVGLVLTKKK